MRLAKHLAHAGVASRRFAEKLIADGQVAIDGIVVTDPATDVTGREAITLGGEPVRPIATEKAVWLLHKPAGVVSTAKDTHKRPVVVDLVDAPGRRLYPVGRLDADTTGLILLTDDGDLAHKLTHPSFEVPKTYRTRVRNLPVKPDALRRLREGVELDDGKTAPARVEQVRPGVLEITIHEGRKRQVKRMCEAVGHPVTKLQRIAFGPLRLGELPVGKARRLSDAEVERLRRSAAD